MCVLKHCFNFFLSNITITEWNVELLTFNYFTEKAASLVYEKFYHQRKI